MEPTKARLLLITASCLLIDSCISLSCGFGMVTKLDCTKNPFPEQELTVEGIAVLRGISTDSSVNTCDKCADKCNNDQTCRSIRFVDNRCFKVKFDRQDGVLVSRPGSLYVELSCAPVTGCSNGNIPVYDCTRYASKQLHFRGVPDVGKLVLGETTCQSCGESCSADPSALCKSVQFHVNDKKCYWMMRDLSDGATLVEQSGMLYAEPSCTSVPNQCQLGTDACEQICIPTANSYRCECLRGSILDPDGHSCIEVTTTRITTNFGDPTKSSVAEVTTTRITTNFGDPTESSVAESCSTELRFRRTEGYKSNCVTLGKLSAITLQRATDVACKLGADVVSVLPPTYELQRCGNNDLRLTRVKTGWDIYRISPTKSWPIWAIVITVLIPLAILALVAVVVICVLVKRYRNTHPIIRDDGYLTTAEFNGGNPKAIIHGGNGRGKANPAVAIDEADPHYLGLRAEAMQERAYMALEGPYEEVKNLKSFEGRPNREVNRYKVDGEDDDPYNTLDEATMIDAGEGDYDDGR